MDYYISFRHQKDDLNSLLYFVSGILLVLLYLWRNVSAQRDLPLPPGPKPLPLIGNALQLPRKAPWETFHDWTSKYGPITSLKVGSRTVIVLGSRDVFRDLLVKRGERYSIRPRLVFVQDYLVQGMPVFLPYGKNNDTAFIHGLLRRIIHPQLGRQMWKVQEIAAKHLLFTFGNNIDSDIGHYLESFASNITSCLLYGAPIGSVPAEYHDNMKIVIDAMIHGACIENVLIDVFPILQYVPGAAYNCKKTAREMKKLVDNALNPLIKEAIQQPRWSMTKELSTNWPAPIDKNDQFQMTILEVEIAGRGTSGITIGIVVTMAALHPKEMEVVYAEMDRVVGNARMPTFQDAEKLVHLQAFIKESTRLRNIVPFGVPHAVTEEDEYMGFRIPTDAIILPNQWALNMDETTFENPVAFLPARWIKNTQLPPPAMFGFGKRACPARHIANGSLLMAMAALVWAFRFEAKEGLSDESDMGASMVFKPQTSKVGISFKTLEHRRIVEREWKAADPDMSSVLDHIGGQLGLSQVGLSQVGLSQVGSSAG